MAAALSGVGVRCFSAFGWVGIGIAVFVRISIDAFQYWFSRSGQVGVGSDLVG